MASFTPNKGLAQPTVGADVGQWGTELNGSMTTLDNNLGGVAAVSLASAPATVVATVLNAQMLVQNFTGALTGNVAYEVPALGGMYICENNTTGAFTVTVKTTAGGSLGTIIPQGTAVAVFSDGTNVNPQTTPNSGSFSNLSVSGTLSVGGTSTLATLNAGAITGTSLTASGGGTISTTGAINGQTITATGNFATSLSTMFFIGGVSGISFANNANTLANVSWDDNGNVTVRGNINGSNGAITTTNNMNCGALVSSGNVSAGGAGGFSGKLGTGGALDGHFFNISWNGSAASLWIDASNIGAISVTSDERVKHSIEPFKGDFISKIRALGVVNYQYRNVGIYKDDGQRHLGFISQEVGKLIPDAVYGEPDAVSADGKILPQSLKPIPLIAMATGAIQQLIARVEALEAALKDQHGMYQEGLPEWPSKTVFSWRERLMAKLRRFLKRWKG